MTDIIGTDGPDSLSGTAGDDTIQGLGGDDRIDGGAGNDAIDGGDGADLLIVSGGSGVLNGGAGYDTVSFLTRNQGVTIDLRSATGDGHSLIGIEAVIGSRYADYLFAGSGGNRLEGREGSDFLRGGNGNDVLLGGAGNDRFEPFGGGSDVIDGGDGTDELNFVLSNSAVVLDLRAGTLIGEGTATVSGIEDVWGSAFADRVTGDDGANVIRGEGGSDILDGGAGNDVIEADGWASDETTVDDVLGGPGDDQITINVNDNADGGEGFDVLNLRFGGDQGVVVDLTNLWGGGTGSVGSGTVTGFESFDDIRGSDGDDRITLGSPSQLTGAAWVLAGWGNDVIVGGANANRLFGGEGDDLLQGMDGGDYLGGEEGDDRIEGGAGDDFLNGGAGRDVLVGGAGSDVYYYSTVYGELPGEDQIVEAADDGGVDVLTIQTSGVLGDDAFAGIRNVEELELSVGTTPTAPFDFVLGANASLAGFKAVTFRGSIDASAMTTGIELRQNEFTSFSARGGAGDDLFTTNPQFRSPWHQTWAFDGGAGFDTIRISSADFAAKISPASLTGRVMLSNIERIVLLPGADAVSVAGGQDQAGTAEQYTLTLGDELIGAGERITVDGSGLRSAVAIYLGSDREIGGTAGNADSFTSERLTLNASALTGGRSVSATGGAAGDSLTGSGGGDVLRGGGGGDLLSGLGGDDELYGDAGDDTLDGGSGVDRLAGGAGDDLYLDFDGADTIVELAGEGSDRVSTQAQAYALADNVENLTFIGVGAFRGSGNDLANQINSIGGGGADILRGFGGNDQLFAGAGDDQLDGGTGVDSLYGGSGNDQYVVDDSGDAVVELAGEGVDTVYASVSLVLAANVENLRLTGSDAIAATGNAMDNGLSGNSGANLLDGGAGADTMAGAGGDDVYLVDSVGDVVGELAGEGTDTVRASVSFALASHLENLVLTGAGASNGTGNDGDNRITGNAAANVLAGQGGNDLLAGGGGTDVLSGGGGADVLSGGADSDLFRDTLAGFNGDTIVDLARGERILFTDADFAAFAFSLSGTTLTYSGGSLTFAEPLDGRLIARAVAGGGVELELAPLQARNDFNGDGRSDVLWRHVGGELAQWLGQASGAFVNNVAAIARVDSSWQILGTGDFNGDGRSDILWRHSSGELAEWLGQGNGGFVNNGASAGALLDAHWRLVETGDFDGNGRDDVLWRHEDGHWMEWLGQADGSLSSNGAAAGSIDSSWQVVGSGDFNGDGRSDILWRHSGGELAEWLGSTNGAFRNNGAAIVRVDTSWRIVGTGDFDGDGRDDILWRHSSGEVGQWLGQPSGGFATNAAVADRVDTNWQIAEIGDFNGDGRDDIVWRHGSGEFAQWLGQANGGFGYNAAGAASIDSNWRIQAPDIFLL